MISRSDRLVLRDLAKEVAEVANLPIMAERRALWTRHNRLERIRPLLLVFPEGGWSELLPPSELHCEGERAREIEWTLRARLYGHHHFDDDAVVEKTWVVSKAISDTGWGLTPSHPNNERLGVQCSFDPDPQIKEYADLAKLRMPRVLYDADKTARVLEETQEFFGDILDVTLKGLSYIGFGLANLYCDLRGLEQVMWDMYDNPGMLHEAMAFIEEGYRQLIQQYVAGGLLSLNNDNSYHASGGVGFSDELPKPGFDPQHVRPCDLWASAESQEMAQVGPALHAEFIWPYEKRLLEPFGLAGYGCCEDLTRKLDHVLSLSNLRRISISPFANVEECAEKLQDRYLFSWKPHPGYLVGHFDPEAIRDYLQHALRATRGCVLEIILKDTHTCEHHPERFTAWTHIAKELVQTI